MEEPEYPSVARTRRAAVVLLLAAGIAGCSSTSGQAAPGNTSRSAAPTASPQQPSTAEDTTPTAPATTAAASSAWPATLPSTCTDARLTAPMAGLISGLAFNSGGLADDGLSCLWGTSVPNADADITASSAATDDTGFQPVDVPALSSIGATAEAKTTSLGGGSATLYISTFVVTMGQIRITVGSSSQQRQDQQVADAAIAIAEKLHT